MRSVARVGGGTAQVFYAPMKVSDAEHGRGHPQAGGRGRCPGAGPVRDDRDGLSSPGGTECPSCPRKTPAISALTPNPAISARSAGLHVVDGGQGQSGPTIGRRHGPGQLDDQAGYTILTWPRTGCSVIGIRLVDLSLEPSDKRGCEDPYG